MAATVYCAAVDGMDAEIITIETKITAGVSYFIVGLPDDAVKESLFRVESAIGAAEYTMPRQKILISMAPASLRKSGAVFDLSIAIGILCESGQITCDGIEAFLFAGELSLNGKLRPIKSALSMAIAAQKAGFKKLIIPAENAAEAAIVSDLAIYGFSTLVEVVRFLLGLDKVEPRQGVPNAQLGAEALRNHCALPDFEKQILIQAMEKHQLSARSHDRILKVARTIADLAGAEKIDLTHLSEAIGYRIHSF